jgi:hypothetical protein
MDRPERFEDDVEDGLAAVPDQKTLVLVGSPPVPRTPFRVLPPPSSFAHARRSLVEGLNPYWRTDSVAR